MLISFIYFIQDLDNTGKKRISFVMIIFFTNKLLRKITNVMSARKREDVLLKPNINKCYFGRICMHLR